MQQTPLLRIVNMYTILQIFLAKLVSNIDIANLFFSCKFMHRLMRLTITDNMDKFILKIFHIYFCYTSRYMWSL